MGGAHKAKQITAHVNQCLNSLAYSGYHYALRQHSNLKRIMFLNTFNCLLIQVQPDQMSLQCNGSLHSRQCHATPPVATMKNSNKHPWSK
jgi:hypothetical protein